MLLLAYAQSIIDQHEENSFPAIAQFWNIYCSVSGIWSRRKFTESDVAMLMALLKIARISQGQSVDDSYADACGYLSLSYGLRQEEGTNCRVD